MSWTITPSFHKNVKMKHTLGGDSMIVLRLECTSDAGAGSITMKTTEEDPSGSYKEYMNAIRGSWLWMVKTVPDGTLVPDGTFDLDVEDENNDHILDTDANSNTANTFTIGSDTLGVYPAIFDGITVVIATLGNTKKTDVYLYFLK